MTTQRQPHRATPPGADRQADAFRPGWPLATTVVLLALLLLSVSGVVDEKSQDYADVALKRAFVTFGAARALDGVISVAQGTDIALEPAGIGVIVSAGEILDPINDLVERFSAVMTLALASLGVQSVLLRISAWWGLNLLLGLAAALLLYVRWRRQGVPEWLRSLAWRFIGAVVFLRFAVPALVMINHLLFQLFLLPDQEQATQALENASVELRELNEADNAAPPDDSFTGRVSRAFQSGLDTMDVERRMQAFRDAVGRTTERIVDLIVVFVLQTVILPIVILWLLGRLLRLVAAG